MAVDIRTDSRLLQTPLIVDGAVEYFDTWQPIDIPVSDSDTIHTVLEGQVGRLDLIADIYYGNPFLWWVIAHANKVEDIFEEIIAGSKIRIPFIDNVKNALSKAIP